MGGLRALSGATTFGILGIVAALGTGIASWISYRSEVERLNTKLDEVKGKHNELKASVQSTESALTNVDEGIKNLIDRYGVLSNDSRQTQLTAKSLQDQFGDLGLAIDDLSSVKVENLLNKMRELRAEMTKKLVSQAYEMGTNKLDVLRANAEDAKLKVKGQLS